jgi:pyridinium-3,5-biscarboxylic acid mononucleotide sulfurtransferase
VDNQAESTRTHSTPETLAKRLQDYFSRQPGAVIAYSGGVDSALLAYIAHRALKNRMVAALADSPSLARRELRAAVAFAEKHRIPLKVVHTEELEDPFYQANQGNRCYYCKKELFEKLKELQKQFTESHKDGAWPLFYGMNMDDLGDHRPGHEAAKEAGIQAPFVEHGVDKNAIRSICSYFGLEIADKPAMPCMSSRIAYGETVTGEKLTQVEKAEDFIYDLGIPVFRVRHHGDIARIEVPPRHFDRIIEKREAISKAFHALGFIYVSLDIDGFKSGSLNKALNPNPPDSGILNV